MDYLKITNALLFAIERHSKQMRDDNKTPFVSHPIAVCEILRENGITDTDIICAAYLHDTVEDTDATIEDINREFGKDVADLVFELTNDKSIPKPERDSRMIEYFKKASRGAKLIKLADRYHNLCSLPETPSWSAGKKAEYVEESKRLLESLQGTHTNLEKMFGDKIKEIEGKVPKRPII